MTKKKHISKLPNSPLQEVVFELFLNEEVDANGNPTTLKYDLSKGVFAREIKSSFPVLVNKPQPGKNIRVFPNIEYQFWKEEKKWPVVQLGNGLLTVNDTDENYTWEKFFGYIQDSIEMLEESLGETLKINKVSLRFIDAIELDNISFNDKINFINKNFKFDLRNDFEIPGAVQTGFNISQSFQIEDKSVINFVLSNGTSNRKKPAIVWQTQIYNNSIQNKQNVFEWVYSAHSIVSDLFKNIITDEFYGSFT